MLCLHCQTPLLAPAGWKKLGPDKTNFEMTVQCTLCRAIWKISQLELKAPDPERLKLKQKDIYVTYCSKCHGQVNLGEEDKHTCPKPKEEVA